jgi:hypothetical protein
MTYPLDRYIQCGLVVKIREPLQHKNNILPMNALHELEFVTCSNNKAFSSKQVGVGYIESNMVSKIKLLELLSIFFTLYQDALRASPSVCQILLGKSCVLPTSKKICQIKKEFISNNLA